MKKRYFAGLALALALTGVPATTTAQTMSETATQEIYDFSGFDVQKMLDLFYAAEQDGRKYPTMEEFEAAGIQASDITAIAFTRGPGLLGSLLVGTSFAKGLALSLDKPLVEVNHLQGHILANFIKQEGAENRQPEFPYLCLLVSGGNSQIVKVNSPLRHSLPAGCQGFVRR